MMFRVNKCFAVIVTATCLFSTTFPLSAQLAGTETRYIRVGSLQSKFTSVGAERAWNNVYYEGLTWPSDYPYEDNAVIERTWIGCQNFTDKLGQSWPNYCVPINGAYANTNVFPTELKETAKFLNPTIYVDGIDVSAPYSADVDDVDPNQIADRVVTNVVNTTMGITMTRRVLAFSQQYHDNYFILEYTFKNTGYVDGKNTQVLNATVKGFRFGFMNRYSVSREGADKMGYDQEYGKHSWTSRRGENYSQHVNDLSSLTESSPIPNWLRAGFEWTGQRDENTYDNIGSPDHLGSGRLCSPQFAGIVTLHVDKSAADRSDNPSQPAVLGWHAGDTYPGLGSMTPSTAPQQADCYALLSGVPYKGLGSPSERMYETYISKYDDPWKVHGDGGGTGIWISYGPWDLNPGDSVKVVIAVGVNGLDRQSCIQIGQRWLQAYYNSSDKGPFTLPDGSTTTDFNVYKDTWVLTGTDSIMKTFSRAVRNYDDGYDIPEPPQPPPVFSVTSAGDRISLAWSKSASEGTSGFAGYKIFRAVGTPDTLFDEIATVPAGTTSYDDVTAQRGFSYYYYISAFSDGSTNTSGGPNPTGPLLSSRFYTKTNIGAYLRRPAGPLPQDATDSIAVSTLRSSPDSNSVQFQLDPRFAGQVAAVTEFSITVSRNDGTNTTITPPDGMLPIRISSTSPTSFTFKLDSVTVARANQVWYKVKIDNAQSKDEVQISMNNNRVSLPDSIVTPYKKWMDAIRIVPNPYNIRAAELQFPGEPDKIEFFNIPGHCTIRIYTENGNLIKTISHENGSGDESWNSNTSSDQVVVSGVYIVHFTVTQDYTDPNTGVVQYRKGDTAYQKCIIIR
jgi:hypothetical protein